MTDPAEKKSKVLTYPAFMAFPREEAEMIVDKWLPTSGCALLWGGRGGGKTFVTLAMAVHIAMGWRFLDMDVPKPRKVLYVDGEMSAAEVQKRLGKLEAGMGPYNGKVANLAFLSHEDFEHGLPDLSEPGMGRHIVDAAAKEHDAELIILDNLSCLLQTGCENEAESWGAFQQWLLNFRREHRSVLCIHHSGKPGSDGRAKQRGTSKREDIMNSSIEVRTTETTPVLHIVWEFSKLRSSTDYEPKHIEILFDKAPDGREIACRVVLAQSPQDEVAEMMHLQEEGMTIREIADRLGVGKSSVGLKLKTARLEKPVHVQP